MDGLVMTAQILLSLSILVAVHEFGHLLTAKYFGMRVEQFSIGFPPKIWSFKKGETEYAISAIPLGGYVKISGMIDESLDTETMNQPPQPWEFRSKPAWQRLIVMLGGIIVNVVMGMLIFTLITFIYGDEYIPKDVVNANGGIYTGKLAEEIGLKTGDQIIKINGEDFEDFQQVIKPDNLLTQDAYYTVVREGKEIEVKIPSNFIENFNDKSKAASFMTYRVKAIVAEVQKETIADRIGLQAGDQFIQVEGKPVTYYDEVIDIVQPVGLDDAPINNRDSISFQISRGGQTLSFKESYKDQKMIGFRPADIDEGQRKVITYGFGESLLIGPERAFAVIFVQLKAFKKIFSGELSLGKSLSGPIGIATAFGGNWDWYRFWSLTGLLSMVLAFMNLLPIPALDGGHVVFLSYEIISGRKPSDRFLENAQKVGMVMLLTLMVFVFGNDIWKLIAPFFGA